MSARLSAAAARSVVAGARRAQLALGLLLLSAATIYTVLLDPHDSSTVFPLCPTKLVTGLDCPACGGLRLVHDAGHGNFSAMAHDNLMLLALSPVIGWLLVRLAMGFARGEPTALPRWFGWSMLGLAIGWTVIRNLPGWPLKPTTY